MEKKSFMKKLTGSREALLAVILVLLFVVITAISPSFLTFKSLTDMLKNNAVTMVMSLGMLCVMLVGGIDISIMSTLALTGMSIGMLLKYDHISSTFLAFVIALAIGIACGFLVGLVISRADVPPIIATMGFMYIYRAMGYLVSHNGEWASAAACVIGGVSMSGGRGTVLGALLGSLILATIAKALPLIPFFDQLWLNTIKGVIILVVVVVNIVLQRTADKNALKGREM